MNTATSILHKDCITTIVSLARQRKVSIYLVGGLLRDAVLERTPKIIDLDFAVSKDAIGLAHAFAKKTKSGFVVLDKEHGCARVLYRDYTLDFTDFRGKDLKEDLLHRDFTINTLAVQLPLANDKTLAGSLIDYYGAAEDLGKRIIRVTSPVSFKEDYLRILRAFSLSAILGFSIDKNTLTLAKKDKKKLFEVAGERVREELFKILGCPQSIAFIRQLDSLGILSCLIPQIECMRSLGQGPYHHLDVWGHSLETLRQFEKLCIEVSYDTELAAYLHEAIAGTRERIQLLKLVCLLHDLGKPQAFEIKEGKTMFHGHERIGRDMAKAVSESLKLSTREKFAIETMIFWHLRPGYLADNQQITERAKFRYFRDTAQEAVAILLLSVADQRATRGPLAEPKSRAKHERVAFELMREYFRRKKEKKFVRLITGDDLIKSLKLKPSPLFKEILQEVEESQAEGKLQTKKQALALAQKIAKKRA